MKKKKLRTSTGKRSVRKSSKTEIKTETKTKHKASKSARPANKVALKATVAQGKPKTAELRHIPWSSVAIEELNPLLGRHFVVGQNVMLARVLLKKGCIVPEHSHHNEQITYILAGALKFGIDGKEIVVNAGEVLTIPPNMPHWAEALADTVDLDIFNPPRADWINKTDTYLR
jgi:quercetin dioxygenase-like cupin family protein